MTSLLNQLRWVAEDLNSLGVDWALIGALAVSVHTEPRTTRDIDVAVVINKATALGEDEIVTKLTAIGYRKPQVLMHVSPTHKLGVRLQVRGATEMPVVVDLLFSSSGIEEEIAKLSERVEIFPGVQIPVACRGHLIAMKVVSQDDRDRIRDRGDLHMLLKTADENDLNICKNALQLISERGFNRGKNLMLELEQFLPRH